MSRLILADLVFNEGFDNEPFDIMHGPMYQHRTPEWAKSGGEIDHKAKELFDRMPHKHPNKRIPKWEAQPEHIKDVFRRRVLQSSEDGCPGVER